MLFSTSRMKVNTPNTNRAGTTAALNGSSWLATWATNPKATRALETEVR
jgi:hypothetical protein